MFERDPATGCAIDPENGDQLRTIPSHPHEDEWRVEVLDQDGRTKFGANFWQASIDHKPTLEMPNDGLSRLVLLRAFRRDESGRSSQVEGQSDEIDRLIDWFERNARTKTNFAGFEFLDYRHKRM